MLTSISARYSFFETDTRSSWGSCWVWKIRSDEQKDLHIYHSPSLTRVLSSRRSLCAMALLHQCTMQEGRGLPGGSYYWISVHETKTSLLTYLMISSHFLHFRVNVVCPPLCAHYNSVLPCHEYLLFNSFQNSDLPWPTRSVSNQLPSNHLLLLAPLLD